MNKVPYSYKKWLQKPLAKIKISTDFIKAVTLRGFKTLEQIISFPLRDLVKKEWFTGSFLYEQSATIDNYWKDLKEKQRLRRNKTNSTQL